MTLRLPSRRNFSAINISHADTITFSISYYGWNRGLINWLYESFNTGEPLTIGRKAYHITKITQHNDAAIEFRFEKKART